MGASDNGKAPALRGPLVTQFTRCVTLGKSFPSLGLNEASSIRQSNKGFPADPEGCLCMKWHNSRRWLPTQCKLLLGLQGHPWASISSSIKWA